MSFDETSLDENHSLKCRLLKCYCIKWYFLICLLLKCYCMKRPFNEMCVAEMLLHKMSVAGVVVVTHLAERSLLLFWIRGSNPVIIFLFTVEITVEKTKINKKRLGMAHFIKDVCCLNVTTQNVSVGSSSQVSESDRSSFGKILIQFLHRGCHLPSSSSTIQNSQIENS